MFILQEWLISSSRVVETLSWFDLTNPYTILVRETDWMLTLHLYRSCLHEVSDI